MITRRWPGLLAFISALGLGVVIGALVVELASAAVPRSLNGVFTRTFHSSDFPRSEEPTGLYTMKIAPTTVIWSAKGLGVPVEQAKTSGKLLLVRDKPGSVGRLCAENGWGSYRYAVKGKTVSFVMIKEPCKQRGEILAQTWTRQR